MLPCGGGRVLVGVVFALGNVKNVQHWFVSVVITTDWGVMNFEGRVGGFGQGM
jgi:hypothetical protein